MMDFNVHPKRLTDPTSATPPPEGTFFTLVDSETRIEPGELFTEAIVTRLPYAMTIRKADARTADGLGAYSYYMADHGGILKRKDKVSQLGTRLNLRSAADLNIGQSVLAEFHVF